MADITGTASMLRCPICRKPVAPLEENPAFPFCSRRCRLVDLGGWLDEKYRIPAEPAEEAEENAEPGTESSEPEGSDDR